MLFLQNKDNTKKGILLVVVTSNLILNTYKNFKNGSMNEEILDANESITDEFHILQWWSEFIQGYMKGTLLFCIVATFICFIFYFKTDPIINLVLIIIYFSFAVPLSMFFIKMIRKAEIANYKRTHNTYSSIKKTILIVLSIIVAMMIPIIAFFAFIVAILPKHC